MSFNKVSATRTVQGRCAAMWGAWLAAVLAGSPALGGEVTRLPDILFIVLDTTRADRFSAWGNPHPTTPNLDALASAGVSFRRHFANSHATRPSFPQLMTSRYYHQNVLGAFRAWERPRDFPFSRPDPSAALLPGVLRTAGYTILGVTAHAWLSADSPLGRHFDQLDFVGGDPSRGHADAAEVVERGLALWRGRDRVRPAFLFVHLMDMHLPRYLPNGEPSFPVAGYDWRARFRPSGEPLFNREVRRWSPADARDFTALDRRHFEAVYDTRLSYADKHLGRLLDAVRGQDPGLGHTLVVVVADHGEELGEDGRTDHTDSLADGVQHIPWIMAGWKIMPGQRVEGLSELIDVVPTILTLLGVRPPAGVRMDGRAQLTPDGRPCADCAKRVAYYAWEDYRAIRTGPYLLRQDMPGSLRARCLGPERLYRVAQGRLVSLPETGRPARVARRLRAHLARRLDAREHSFLRNRYDVPSTSFLVRADSWGLSADTSIGCVPVDAHTERGALQGDGWLWSGRGVIASGRGDPGPLRITLTLPDADYQVEAAVVATAPMPQLLGFSRWLRESFLPETPTGYVPVGGGRAREGVLSVDLPPSIRGHIVGLRLTPSGVALEPSAPAEGAGHDDESRRLRALGYVQ